MTETRTISKGDAEFLSCFDSPDERAIAGDWAFEAKSHIRRSRWVDHYWLVLRHSDGTTWGIKYSDGLTEYQENDYPWDSHYEGSPDDLLELVRLYPYEVTTTEYSDVP